MMRTICLILLTVVLFLGVPGALAQGFEPLPIKDPALIAERFYTNPLGVAEIGDPYILSAQGRYYLFATGGTVGYNVWRSDDLRVFSDRQKAFRKADWASGDYWAPEVYEHQGRYYMFFSARRKADASLRVGVAVASQPEGPYTDPLGRPLFDFGYAAIDASLFIDTDGTPYLYYSRDCSENLVEHRHESHIYVVRLAKDLLSPVGEAQLLTVPDLPWETRSGDWRWNEGPSVLKHQGHYYLYYSANYFATKEYGVGYAVSDSPTGPYVKPADNHLMTFFEDERGVRISGPGHNSFFRVGEEWFTAYHTHRYLLAPSGNRQLNIDRVGFCEDGSAFINGPSLGKRLLPLSLLGLRDAALTAHLSVGSGQAEYLRDGDEALASLARAWQPVNGQAWAQLDWDEPPLVDCLLIYPASRQTGRGRLLLNGRLAIDIEMTPERLPGEPVILYFEPLALFSLRLELEGSPALGEIRVLGAP